MCHNEFKKRNKQISQFNLSKLCNLLLILFTFCIEKKIKILEKDLSGLQKDA